MCSEELSLLEKLHKQQGAATNMYKLLDDLRVGLGMEWLANWSLKAESAWVGITWNIRLDSFPYVKWVRAKIKNKNTKT